MPINRLATEEDHGDGMACETGRQACEKFHPVAVLFDGLLRPVAARFIGLGARANRQTIKSL